MANLRPEISTNAIIPDAPREIMRWNPGIVDPNKFARRIDASLELYNNTNSQTLNVENELKRFAKNEYFRTRNDQVLVGSDDNAIQDEMIEDDLLLTNAITENTVQDTIDKTRYLKEVRTYVEVCSAARLTSKDVPDPLDASADDFYTGPLYLQIYRFGPFKILGPDEEQNIQNRYSVVNQPVSDGSQNLTIGQTQDYTANMPPIDTATNFLPFEQGFSQDSNRVIINSNNNGVFFAVTNDTQNTRFLNQQTGDISYTFYIPVGSYSLLELQDLLQKNFDALLKGIFQVRVTPGGFTDNDKVIITVSTQNEDPLADIITYIMRFSAPINVPKAAVPALSSDGTQITPAIAPEGVPLSIEATQGSITYFPYANNYILTLDRAINNVKSVRLVSSEIPKTDTIVNIRNNTITFFLTDGTGNFLSPKIPLQDISVLFTLFLTPGNYTVPELAKTLELELNNLVFGETGIDHLFTVTANLTTGVFSISVKSPYNFLLYFGVPDREDNLGTRSLWRMLGYEAKSNEATQRFIQTFDNTVQVNANTVERPSYISVPFGAFNLRTSNVIWMNLNGYETVFDTISRNFYFAKFSTKNIKENDLLTDTFTSAPMVFKESPLPSIDRVVVSFFDENGAPYEFNNVDHSFCLEFTSHLDRFMGSDISSRRGVPDHTSYI